MFMNQHAFKGRILVSGLGRDYQLAQRKAGVIERPTFYAVIPAQAPEARTTHGN